MRSSVASCTPRTPKLSNTSPLVKESPTVSWARIQAQIRGGLRYAATAGAIAVEVVVEQARVHAGVPVFRIDVAARTLTHVGLRHAHVQPQVGHIERHAGAGNHVGDVDAGMFVGQLLRDLVGQVGRVQPQLVEQALAHAGGRADVGGGRGEAHVAAAHRDVVEEYVDAVAARQHEVATLEARQVGGVLASAGKHAAIERGIRGVSGRDVRAGANGSSCCGFGSVGFNVPVSPASLTAY